MYPDLKKKLFDSKSVQNKEISSDEKKICKRYKENDIQMTPIGSFSGDKGDNIRTVESRST